MIKNVFIFNIGFLISIISFCYFISLENIRKDYTKSASDKELCRKMVNELEKNVESNIHLAYLGALQAIWAGHSLLPIDKLKSFKKGKNNIEVAIKKEKDNVEIRFIRLSIQKNSPEFLNYKSNIKEDELFLKNNKENIHSPQLKSMINNILEK